MSNALTSRQRHLNAVTGVDLGVLYTVISAGMVLVRRYLTGRGIDQDFADRYGSAFGRTAAKIYRTSNGAEPRRAWSNVSGKWRRVNGYLPTETEILDEAFTIYKRTAEYVAPEPAPEPSPVDVYNKVAGHFPAQFADLTGETLRSMERAGSTAAVEEFVTAQLDDLDTWKQANEQYDRAMVGDVDKTARDAAASLPWDDPHLQAFLTAERGQDDHGQAQAILNAAVVDWLYDLTGTVEVPDVPRPPAPVIPQGCRIPGCDGTWHYDGQCVAQLGEVQFEGADVALPAELVIGADDEAHIVASAYNMSSLNIRREMRDRTSAREFTAQLRRLADAIDDAAAHLPA
ncbi:hypothetical protein ACFVAF_04075 [Streptomyces sp. NPDC057596]|uniref:hypothetical protein n=1 Tax=Streptomyces sp. NPDC057596 TaxID=3346178 RepID=UPI0036AE2A44